MAKTIMFGLLGFLGGIALYGFYEGVSGN